MAAVHDEERDGFAWRERGEGSAVVLLHGLGGSRLSWEPQLGPLGERCRAVAWDLPGYGASDPLTGPVTFPALGAAVQRFAGVLGVARLHLVGISFGGMIAQYVAALHPQLVRSLTLIATSPKFGLDGTDPGEWRAARLARLDAGDEPGDFAAAVLRGLAGPGIDDVALAEQCAAMARITADALRTSIDCLVTHDSRPLLGRITAPTLCIAGELDAETPVAYLQAIADGIPGARLEVVAGAGHLVNAEAPGPLNRLLIEHVEQSERGGHDTLVRQ